MEIDKTSRFLREDGVYATPQYESDLPLKVIGGEVNMLSNAKPLFLDETGKSINASLQKIASAIKSGGGGGGGDVPTKLSELENDVGFITNSANDLTNYYNKTQADSLLEGKVSTEPGKSLSTNDYTTEDKNKLRDLTQVTESTVSDWGFTKNTGTYSKPSDGIPKSDLNAEVQTSLSKADTALQSHQDISGKADKVANATSGHLAALDLEGNLTDSGSKPSDFASATEQTELKENLTELDTRVETLEKRFKGTIYGFHVNSNESDANACVIYLEDAVKMTPAHMNYSTGKFDYGSWKNAFFMPRPCMLNTNGTVAYYLDENDFSKKEDGTPSDIANTSFDGNAMMEWGRDGKKIWYKLVPDNGDVTSYSVYIADYEVDSTYHAWSFFNKDNQLVDHFYTACYTGSLVNNKLRSLSGQNIMHSQSGTSEIGYAKANGDYYNIEHWSDTSLIFLLLYLMGKSLDVQTTFGNGHMNGGSSEASLTPSGQLNDKGLFYGYNDGTHKVKVFGMEDLWAEQWRRTQGLMLNNGVYYYKLTEGTADGSTANGYRTTDTNGMLSGGASPTNTNYISKMKVVGSTFLPTEVSGASNKYYCDYFYQNKSGVQFALLGGASYQGAHCGLTMYLYASVSLAYWDIGATLSYKPKEV